MGVRRGLGSTIIYDFDPLDLQLSALSRSHGAAPLVAVGPGVKQDRGGVDRRLELVRVDELAVDVPAAGAGGPVVAVRAPRGPRVRDRDLVRGVGPRDAVYDGRLVRVVHLVGRVRSQHLDVGFLHVGLGRPGPVREHGCYAAGGPARPRVHAHRQVLVVGRDGLDLGRGLEVAGGVAVRAQGEVRAGGRVGVRVALDVDVVLGVGVVDGARVDPCLYRPRVGEVGAAEVGVGYRGVGRAVPVVDGRRDSRVRYVAEVEELLVREVLG